MIWILWTLFAFRKTTILKSNHTATVTLGDAVESKEIKGGNDLKLPLNIKRMQITHKGIFSAKVLVIEMWTKQPNGEITTKYYF